jgi:hypothetical protein
MILMHTIDIDALYYKLEKIIVCWSHTNRGRYFWNKTKATRITDISDSTISILGVNIPIGSWFYFVSIIILILFHNFTDNVRYRGRLIKKIPMRIPDWRQGPYILGFRNHQSTDTPSGYMEIVSSLIAVIFLMLPVITSLLFIMSSY